MRAKLQSERRWRSIERYVRHKARSVSVRQLARKFKLAASNVSRGLQLREIKLVTTFYSWEAAIRPIRRKQARKRRQALALFFLGVRRQKIERFLPIKSETVRRYILALTFLANSPENPNRRMFREEALKALTQELEEAYGLGDDVDYVFRRLDNAFFPSDEGAFFRRLRTYIPKAESLAKKVCQIVGAKVRPGSPIQIKGRDGRPVKV
jgi:hypothetical protein